MLIIFTLFSLQCFEPKISSKALIDAFTKRTPWLPIIFTYMHMEDIKETEALQIAKEVKTQSKDKG